MPVPSLAYQKILVPLDGSETAEFAIPYAVDLVRKHGAELILLRLEHLATPIGDTGTSAMDDATWEQMQQRLNTLGSPIREEGLRVRDAIIESHNLSESLLGLVESEHVSVIVMSTQGRTPMMRWLFGSNIEKALSTIPVPVMLVRPVYHKIVVPLDGSRWSESAIPQAVEIARAHNAELILLHVYQSPTSNYADQLALAGQQHMADQTYDQMREQLVSLRNRLRREGLRVTEQMIRSHNPAQAICDFVESEQGVSMVVMSTHGRTGLSRWLFGSVAQKVIKNLRVPVTLVRPNAV